MGCKVRVGYLILVCYLNSSDRFNYLVTRSSNVQLIHSRTLTTLTTVTEMRIVGG